MPLQQLHVQHPHLVHCIASQLCSTFLRASCVPWETCSALNALKSMRYVNRGNSKISRYLMQAREEKNGIIPFPPFLSLHYRVIRGCRLHERNIRCPLLALTMQLFHQLQTHMFISRDIREPILHAA